MKYKPPVHPKVLTYDHWEPHLAGQLPLEDAYKRLFVLVHEFDRSWRFFKWEVLDCNRLISKREEVTRNEIENAIMVVERHVEREITHGLCDDLEKIAKEAKKALRNVLDKKAEKLGKETAKAAQAFRKSAPKEIMDANRDIAKELFKIADANEKDRKRKLLEIRKAITALAKAMKGANTVDAFNAFRRNEIGALAFLLAKHSKELNTDKEYQSWKRFAAESFDAKVQSDIAARLRVLVPAIKALAQVTA